MRKRLLSLAATLVLFQTVIAADSTWLTDLPKAKQQAKAEGKLVLLDFTGSDFCSSCIRLHKEVFPAKEFAAFAKQRLILVEVDFPLKRSSPPRSRPPTRRCPRSSR